MLFDFLLGTRNLWSAAKYGNVKAIYDLVANGHSVDAKKHSLNVEGETPLHFAARAGKIQAIRALLQLHARIDAKDENGMTPLMDSVTQRNRETTVITLLDAGAEIDLQDRTGSTALCWAAFFGNREVVRLLLSRGANPNVRRGDKLSAPVARCVEGGNIDVLHLLLQAKADVEARYGGWTALQNAAVLGRLVFVEALLRAGADVNAVPDEGSSPLILAVRSRSVDIVERLLIAGADVHARTKQGQSALDIAQEMGNHKIVKVLQEAIEVL